MQHKISQKNARDLLEQTAELVVCLRSWGLHLPSSFLQARNADTGKVINPQSNPLQDIQDLIIKIRRTQKKA